MSAIYFLIPLTLVILAGAIYLFIWAVKSEQFSDLERHGRDILFDDDDDDDDDAKDKPQKSNNPKEPD